MFLVKIFSSKSRPILLELLSTDEKIRKRYIVKNGDNLWIDIGVTTMFRLFNHVLFSFIC
jgi:hypothetical protein